VHPISRKALAKRGSRNGERNWKNAPRSEIPVPSSQNV